MKRLAGTLALGLLSLGSCWADITIGTATGANCFPFGCDEGNIYQQVYAASDFSGPITITDVGFFDTVDPGASIVPATYVISFSTTSAAVDGLNTSDFDANLGPDNSLFFSGTLGGPIGSSFDILSNVAPFDYNPASGNLLMDIRVTGASDTGTAFLDAMNSDAGGLFSRAHNYGSGFEGFGLVTKFSTGEHAVPEPSSVLMLASSLFLVGYGLRRKRV